LVQKKENMPQSAIIRRWELAFWIGVALIYCTRRLFQEAWSFEALLMKAEQHLPPAVQTGQELAAYDHALNTNFPIIAGSLLFLGAWYFFHFRAYPHIETGKYQVRAYLYLALAGLLLVSSVFLFHYFKLYIRFKHDNAEAIIGLKVYSLYRKQVIFSDVTGAAIVLGLYELFAQLYYYFHRRVVRHAESLVKYFSYFLLLSIAGIVVSAALSINLPPVLWNEQTRHLLLTGGIIIQVYILHHFLYHHFLPLLQQPGTPKIPDAFLRVLLITLVGNALLWAPFSRFNYRDGEPVLLLIFANIFLSGVSAYLRWALAKEQTVFQARYTHQAAELSNLRTQINPHFLFNALNSLYGAALKENSGKTADGIQKLGDMMRFMLEENNRDRIPLEKEIEYLHNYIHLQKIRLDESRDIDITVRIQEPGPAIFLAPMLLIPFVENAFKHGISLRNPSWIAVTLTLDASSLYFKVHNSRHSKPAIDPEEGRGGIGLSNVTKRLELIYPQRHSLEIQQSEQDYFVLLTINFN
jgi:two-component system, LytTR family, sensor kinase